VKRSNSDKAKRSLGGQLVDRYMQQLCVSHGLYIVGWFGHCHMGQWRSVWKTLDECQDDLAQQAQAASIDGRRVAVIVIDASLR